MEGNECLRHWTSYIHSLVFYLHIHNLYDSFLCTTFCVINNISLYRLSQIQLSYGRRSVWRDLIVFSAHSLQQQSVTAFSISCICPAGVSFCSICVCLIGPVNCEAQGNVQMFIRGLMCCVRVRACVVSGHIQCGDGSCGGGLVMRSVLTEGKALWLSLNQIFHTTFYLRYTSKNSIFRCWINFHLLQYLFFNTNIIKLMLQIII